MTTKQIPSPVSILALFNEIDPADVSAGLNWYADAYSIAETLGIRYSVTTEQAAGVIAALSPLNQWEKNVRDAERVLSGDYSGNLPLGLDKSRRIIAGQDIETVLNGPKIVNFYRSIISRGVEGITIDRHAWDIAVGVRNTDKGRRVEDYDAAVQAYVAAAAELESQGLIITPAELQSVTWTEQVRRHGGSRA